MTYDPKPVIARCRAHVKAHLGQLGLPEAGEDVDELPIVFAAKSRVTTLCGCFQHIAADGLGRVTVYPRQCPTPERLEATLLHEFAHALVHWMQPDSREPHHGRLFRYVMLTLGQEPSPYVLGVAAAPQPHAIYKK